MHAGTVQKDIKINVVIASASEAISIISRGLFRLRQLADPRKDTFNVLFRQPREMFYSNSQSGKRIGKYHDNG